MSGIDARRHRSRSALRRAYGRAATTRRRSRAASSWRSSARTAPARARCCARWPASSPHAGTVTWERHAARSSSISRARARARRLPAAGSADALAAARARARGARPAAASRLRRGRAPRRHDAVAGRWSKPTRSTFAGRSVRSALGRRARTRAARASARGRAPVLLVDEPIAMLDPYHQLHVMSALRDPTPPGNDATGLVVAVLHDLGARRTILQPRAAHERRRHRRRRAAGRDARRRPPSASTTESSRSSRGTTASR